MPANSAAERFPPRNGNGEVWAGVVEKQLSAAAELHLRNGGGARGGATMGRAAREAAAGKSGRAAVDFRSDRVRAADDANASQRKLVGWDPVALEKMRNGAAVVRDAAKSGGQQVAAKALKVWQNRPNYLRKGGSSRVQAIHSAAAATGWAVAGGGTVTAGEQPEELTEKEKRRKREQAVVAEAKALNYGVLPLDFDLQVAIQNRQAEEEGSGGVVAGSTIVTELVAKEREARALKAAQTMSVQEREACGQKPPDRFDIFDGVAKPPDHLPSRPREFRFEPKSTLDSTGELNFSSTDAAGHTAASTRGVERSYCGGTVSI